MNEFLLIALVVAYVTICYRAVPGKARMERRRQTEKSSRSTGASHGNPEKRAG